MVHPSNSQILVVISEQERKLSTCQPILEKQTTQAFLPIFIKENSGIV